MRELVCQSCVWVVGAGRVRASLIVSILGMSIIVAHGLSRILGRILGRGLGEVSLRTVTTSISLLLRLEAAAALLCIWRREDRLRKCRRRRGVGSVVHREAVIVPKVEMQPIAVGFHLSVQCGRNAAELARRDWTPERATQELSRLSWGMWLSRGKGDGQAVGRRSALIDETKVVISGSGTGHGVEELVAETDARKASSQGRTRE